MAYGLTTQTQTYERDSKADSLGNWPEVGSRSVAQAVP